MKKAFDQNVSRTKPRLRLGAFTETTTQATEREAPLQGLDGEASPNARELRDEEPSARNQEVLGDQIRARLERAKAPTVPLAEALGRALEQAAETSRGPVARSAPLQPVPETVEVQQPSRPAEVEVDSEVRRERLRERLKAARENPRPEPLPPTVQQAGLLAVERIATLQTELAKTRTLNLALTQDLESTRRQAERATEEARMRMDEARRLAADVEARVSLLKDLERELSSIEGERDEALLSLQEARASVQAGAEERETLTRQIERQEQSLEESLSEEERLAVELEAAQDDSRALRSTLDALSNERDTLARQVSDLTSERAELMEARKALEAVHRALSHAATR